MIILEEGDTALVLSQTLLEAQKDSEYSMDREQQMYLRKIHKANGCVQ